MRKKVTVHWYDKAEHTFFLDRDKVDDYDWEELPPGVGYKEDIAPGGKYYGWFESAYQFGDLWQTLFDEYDDADAISVVILSGEIK